MQKTSFSDSSRDGVVDDLLKRYPAGPAGAWVKGDYSSSWEWSQAADVYRDTPVPPKAHFGYSPETMMRVYWGMNKGNVRNYIRERWPDISYKAVSRRENRLLDRVKPGVNIFQRGRGDEEGRGIWEVRLPEVSIRIHVIASSEESAKIIGRTVAAGAGIVSTGKNDYYAFQSSLVNTADVELLKHYREEDIESCRSQLKRTQKAIRKQQREAAALVELSVSLLDFNEHQEKIEDE